MNINTVLRNYWLLPIFIFIQHIKSFVMDLTKIQHTGNDIWTFLCDYPVLSSGSEELLVPGYYYSLEKGGRMTGYVKIASVEELDENLVVPDVPVMISSNGREGSFRTEFESSKGKRVYPLFTVRWRMSKRNKIRNHHNFTYLVKTLFQKEEKKELKHPFVGAPDDSNLDNMYLILFSQAQWQLYLSTGPYDNVQPSRNKRGFVYYSNVISKMRIPITKVGDVISFEFISDQPDRYVLLIFNPDQRKMKLEGYVKYDNPNGLGLPVEMKYHFDILVFWWIANLLAFLVSCSYLFFYLKTGTKVNYLLSLNFLLNTTFLLLDLVIVNFIRTEGMVHKSVWALSHIFKRLHEIYILTLMVLLSLGWKILRDTLSAVESQLISSICGICILMGFVEVLVSGFDISRYLVHAIACICILVAANFNIVIINTRIADETLTPQAGLAYSHMKTFSNFRFVFFIYMFKPAIFSTIRFICLQPTLDQVIIWDQHLNLFIDLTFDFFIHAFFFFNFLPYTKKGLFNHIFQNQAITQENDQNNNS